MVSLNRMVVEMSDSLSERESHEKALSEVRDAIAALQGVPATALSEEQHDQLTNADGDLRSLERALTNEVEQLRESDES